MKVVHAHQIAERSLPGRLKSLEKRVEDLENRLSSFLSSQREKVTISNFKNLLEEKGDAKSAGEEAEERGEEEGS